MLRHAGWHGTDVAIHQIPGVDFEPSCQFKRRNRNNTMSTIALRRKKSGYQVAMDPWLALLGWYIAEGCTVRPRINRGKPGRGYIVDIRQYDPTNIAEIVRLARACGFRPAVKKEGRVQIYSKVLYSHLSPLGKAGDKHIPAYARQLSTRQLRILFTTMMKGDGSLHEDGSPKCYYTKSRRLADHVSEVAIKLGMGATATLRPGSQAHRKGPVYQVCFSTQRLVHKIQKSNVSYEQYDGFVYDVTVPNHIIMVRRNGRSIWSGNCGDFEGGREKAPAAICRKVIEAKLSGRHEIEIWGDGQATRSFMYIDDCIDGTIRIMDGDYPHPVNLGSSELVTINGLVDIVEEIAGVKLKRTHNLSAPQGVRGRNSDNTLIKRLFDWEPSTPLRVGLERTYAWIYDEMTNPARKHS